MNHRKLSAPIIVVSACMLSLLAINGWPQSLTPKEQLGKSIFFDQNLSIQNNQSCAACHSPETGFTGPDALINAHGSVYEGSIPGRFGDRKPPSAAYATQSPVLHFVTEKKEALFVGGNFWDGRATGENLGNPAADQALGPFLNPAEQVPASSIESATQPTQSASKPSGVPVPARFPGLPTQKQPAPPLAVW